MVFEAVRLVELAMAIASFGIDSSLCGGYKACMVANDGLVVVVVTEVEAVAGKVAYRRSCQDHDLI